MPSSVATDLNLHTDFKLWLKNRGIEGDLKMLDSLCLLVCNRFWAVLKNCACLFSLEEGGLQRQPEADARGAVLPVCTPLCCPFSRRRSLQPSPGGSPMATRLPLVFLASASTSRGTRTCVRRTA
mmetsp:Transcript_2386/g.4796  ORF Transcript_2386/g.4796 Transcript_2386/m.4796 type:complete len:125 (+) Transcript_2386:245-619(+)